jgi:hypothetical protein
LVKFDRVLALSFVFILLGILALALSYFPKSDSTPKTAIMMWAGPMDKIKSSQMLFMMNLTSKPMIRLLYTIQPAEPPEGRIYYFDMWFPFMIQSPSWQLLWNTGHIAGALTPFSDGTAWVSLNASLLSPGQFQIDVRFGVRDLVSIHEPARDAAVITFRSSSGAVLPNQVADHANRSIRLGSEDLFDNVDWFLVVANYANDTVLSPETFPPPTQIYATAEAGSARWLLNFTSPLPHQGQSLSISLSSPERVMCRDIKFFLAGLFSALGAGGLFESLRDHNRGKCHRNTDFSNTEP